MGWRPLSKPQGAPGERPSMEAVLDRGEWRAYGENHLVSSEGLIWSLKYKRVLKCPSNRDGYRTVSLNGRSTYVHSVVLETFVGPRPPGFVARHLNDIPGDDRLENLAWGSRQENSADAICNGRQMGQVGSNHIKALLTEEKVKDMRAMREEGFTYVELARIFGVAPETARHAVAGVKWKHVA